MYIDYDEEKALSQLVEMRKQRGLTQKQVEQSLGLRALTIYDYESGRLKLSIELAIKLCQLYQCQLDELLGLETVLEENPSHLKALSLASLGLIGGRQKMFLQTIFKDPIILAEIGEMEYELPEAPFELLLESLSENQKRKFAIEVLKYINSLIGIDQKITTQEIELRDHLIEEMSIEFDDSEIRSIRKALSIEYYGKTVEKKFPRMALRHFLVWTLFVVALSDGEMDHRESEFIENVASHLGIKKKDFEFIKTNSLNTLVERKEE